MSSSQANSQIGIGRKTAVGRRLSRAVEQLLAPPFAGRVSVGFAAARRRDAVACQQRRRRRHTETNPRQSDGRTDGRDGDGRHVNGATDAGHTCVADHRTANADGRTRPRRSKANGDRDAAVRSTGDQSRRVRGNVWRSARQRQSGNPSSSCGARGFCVYSLRSCYHARDVGRKAIVAIVLACHTSFPVIGHVDGTEITAVGAVTRVPNDHGDARCSPRDNVFADDNGAISDRRPPTTPIDRHVICCCGPLWTLIFTSSESGKFCLSSALVFNSIVAFTNLHLNFIELIKITIILFFFD